MEPSLSHSGIGAELEGAGATNRAAVMVAGSPNALEGLLSNPGMQCTIFPFLGATGDSDVACWDLWYNTFFVHEFASTGDFASPATGAEKWDKNPGINPYIFGYVGLALAISISVLGAAW